mgnify:CR=1 FL=1
MSPRVLVLDNYDSFVYNLVQYIGELGGEPLVYRNDMVTLSEAKKLKPDRIVISPGPGNPSDERYFGVCSSILRELSKRIPTLGVCLGHQGIAAVYGGKVISAKRLLHGKTSRIQHDGKSVFRGLENPFEATRYHSLAVDERSLPGDLEVTARALEDGEVMGLRHRRYPIEGVQFHPESILTKTGIDLIRNFIIEGVRS